MGTNEQDMAWIHDEIGRVAGLPRELGGIPLDEIGATGLGCAVASEVAAETIGMPLRGARVAVQGFGAVGRHAARLLVERGAVLVAAADSKGVVWDENGIDPADLARLKDEGGSVRDLAHGKKGIGEAIVGVDCDIWIPAARPDVLTEANVGQLKARIVIQGANIPATAGAEKMMHECGILSVPDFIANAGGVICASIEYHGGSEQMALQIIESKIKTNVTAVLSRAREEKREPRSVAVALAVERVKRAMALRRWN
jgi:glutamate dehydrogenase (NAD(P)+)